MNKYQLTVVLSGKTTPAKTKSFKEKFEKIIKVFNGKIESFNEWGKEIELAYSIEKNNSGIFFDIELELNSESVSKLDEKLKVDTDIIRYLLIRK